MNYLFIICIFLIIALLSPIKYKNVLTNLFAIVISYAVALRDVDKTPDTDKYIYCFDHINLSDSASFIYFQFEPGFQILTQIIKLLCDNHVVFLFSCALITNIIFVNTTKKLCRHLCFYGDTLLCYMLYTSFFGLFYTSIVIRQGLSMSLLYWITIDYLTKKNNEEGRHYLIYVTIFLIAFSMHYSSIVYILAFMIMFFTTKITPPVIFYKISLLIILLFLFSGLSQYFVSDVSSNILSVFNQSSMYEKYDYYSKDLKNLAYNIPFRLLFQLAIGYIILLVPIKNRCYFQLYNVYFFGLIFSCLFSSIAQISRIADYFLLSGFLLQAWFISLRFKNQKKGNFVMIVSICLYLLFFIRVLNDVH